MSCIFDAKGNTLEDCFNQCQAENKDENCSTECTKICSDCTDMDKCSWLSSQSEQELDSLQSNYNELTDRIIEYKKKEKELWDTDLPEEEGYEIQISLLQKIKDLDEKKKIIWNYLVNEYNVNTQITDSNNKVISKSNKLIQTQKDIIHKNRESLDSIKNLSNTKKRIIDMNTYRFKKLQYHTSLLFSTLYFLLFLFIFLILFSVKILSKKATLVFYFGLLIIWVIYIIVKIIGNSNRDDHDWDKYNFKKPDISDIGHESLIKNMSESDKQKCMALSDAINTENYNPSDIDIGDISKFINDPNKCAPISEPN